MSDAIALEFETSSQWIHLPERYDSWRGVYNRLLLGAGAGAGAGAEGPGYVCDQLIGQVDHDFGPCVRGVATPHPGTARRSAGLGFLTPCCP
ncbi:hypothetical protein [Streptomyces fulvoviolaceus]|uniref:hypothetical protein n=1 Tax=Streptomyces fulvoviolaceus TaxID=285535 RepID=UPI00131AF846|nr:hypothetical protein [Streptomyces fulvoviolaceus]